MKKAVGLLGILSILLFAVQAQAVTLGEYANGALVPSVYHDGAMVDTVVGITCQFQCSVGQHTPATDDTGKARIHWTFYDVDSHHVTDGNLICTDDDLVGFSWKAAAGRNLDKKEGYLVFHMMTDNVTMSANAFLVDQQAKDAIFIPVIPLLNTDFASTPDPNDPDKLINLQNGIAAGTPIDVRYWMDPTYNAATTIVVWLVDPYKAGNKALPLTVIAWNDNEVPKSVTIQLPHELNKIIPCEIAGMPLDFVDGFISMTIPATPTNTVAGFAYSYISSSLFGAQQTLLAAECKGPPSTGRGQPSCGCSGAGY